MSQNQQQFTIGMPLTNQSQHQLSLGLPPGLDAKTEVLVCRYTGEIFNDYEDFISKQTEYRRRVWSCKFSGNEGLTYEEAVTSEHKVAAVVSQFPALFEEAALRVVHHSTDAVEQLTARILAHFGQTFVSGEEVMGMMPDGKLAPCVICGVKAVQPPQLNGSSPADSEIDGKREGAAPASGPQLLVYEVEWLPSNPSATLPAAPAPQRSVLKREGLMRRHPSPITALTPTLLRKWLETVAWAEPVTGVPGVDCVWHVCNYFREKYGLSDQLPAEMAERLRPSRQKAMLKSPSQRGSEKREVEFVDTLYDEEADGADGAGFRDRDFHYEYDEARGPDDDDYESDDDYRPMHPGMEARMKPKPRPSRTPRRGRSRRHTIPRVMREGTEPPPPPPPTQPPPPPSLQASDVQLMVESIEEVERRMQPGSIKHAVFTVLREAGDSGMALADLVSAMEDKGLKTWDDPRQAKNSVASTCGHDPAFVRVGPAKFALRALVSPQQLVADDSVSFDQLDEGSQKQLALVGQQQKEAMRRLAEETHKPKVEKNNFKCPKCHRTTHPELSPLLLCDTCPRAYHMCCLGLDWRDLPSDDWCCPKCVESTQAALRRVMDLETRKKEALERAQNKEKEAEDKLLRRLLQKEERDRRKADTPGGSAAKLPRAKVVPDDWEVLQEERENLGRLEIRSKELLELAARNPLPEEGIEYADDETVAVHQRAAETQEALQKLDLILAGPPTFPPLVPPDDTPGASRNAQTVLNEMLSLAEFLKLFGDACVAPIMTVQDLYKAVTWPLDSPSLAALYSAMLQCCLLEQLNHDPPSKGRARRWNRMLTLSDGVWPEILRRYLLVTRAKADPEDYDNSIDPVLMSDDQVALYAAEHLSQEEWWKLPPGAHLRLLNVLCYDVAQGYRLRAEINQRQQETLRVQTERFRESQGKKRGAEAAQPVAPAGGGKRKKGGKKAAAAAAALAEPTEEELEAAEAEAAELEELEGELDDAAQARRQRDAEYDAQLQACASRTEPLGLDRYHRRYWWLASDPGFVFVENSDGEGGMGAISTTEQLDEVVSKLNRRGPREGVLHRNIRKRYAAITASLAKQDDTACYIMAEVPRPLPTDRRMAVRSLEYLAEATDREALAEAKEKLELFITETQDIGVQLGCELKEIRRQLRAVEGPQQMCDFLMVFESFLGTAGEGLPAGADNISITPLLGESIPLPEAPSSTALDVQDTAQGGRAHTPPGLVQAAVKAEEEAGEGAAGEGGGPAGGVGNAEALVAVVKREPESGAGEQKEGGQQPEQGGEPVQGEPMEGVEAGAAQEPEPGDAVKAEGAGAAVPEASAAGVAAGAGDEGEGAAVPPNVDQAGGVKPEGARDGETLDGSCGDVAAAAAAEAGAQSFQGSAALGKPPLPPSGPAAAAASGQGASGSAQPAGADAAPALPTAPAAQHRALARCDSLGGGDTSSLGAGTTGVTGDDQAEGSGGEEEAEKLHPVTADDDLEDSDAEHAFLREKRMRRPARLWRSAKERAVWIKMVHQAGGMAPKACYCALLLRDRAGPMLQRFINIADEQARWEAEEKERQRIERAESRKRLNENGDEGPPERPLMIRTGKAKTDEGVKIVLKAMGKTPFAMGRGASSIEVMAAPEQVASCRWGYQCSVCLLAGDLLCCEHPDGCNVSCHPECTGLSALPKGPYVCMNHDSRELKTRIRRRASSSMPAKEEAAAGGGDGMVDDEETVSEDTQTVDSEATEDEAPRGRSARKKPRKA